MEELWINTKDIEHVEPAPEIGTDLENKGEESSPEKLLPEPYTGDMKRYERQKYERRTRQDNSRFNERLDTLVLPENFDRSILDGDNPTYKVIKNLIAEDKVIWVKYLKAPAIVSA